MGIKQQNKPKESGNMSFVSLKKKINDLGKNNMRKNKELVPVREKKREN